MSRLDELLAVVPKSRVLAPRLVAGLAGVPPHEIEHRCMELLVEGLGTMCVLFFELHASRSSTVATMLDHDDFALAPLWIERLTPTDSDQSACLDTIVDLLLRSAAALDRCRSEVKSELIAAYLLANALRNVRSKQRALDRIVDVAVVRRDELYRSLDKAAGLPELLEAVRQRFAPRAWIAR